MPYITNLEKDTQENTYFRKVLYTAKHSQLVLMCLQPQEEIGMEVHTLDQFFRIESGTGTCILDGVESQIADGSGIVVPAGTQHNLINTSETELMKLYTVYSPPDHRDGTVHKTKAEAVADTNDHYEG